MKDDLSNVHDANCCGEGTAVEALGREAPEGWQPIALATAGEWLLYFPADTRRHVREMMRVDRVPVTSPRKPTHFMKLPDPPRAALLVQQEEQK